MPTAGAPSSNRVESLALYRRAANYIAAAMIYLQDNHLLEEPLKPEHIKHRLLGHWGTVPGINLMYAGLNRLILDTGASVLLVTGPGHGAPANLANLWIDGCLEDVRPELSRDRDGPRTAGPQLLLAGRLPEPPRRRSCPGRSTRAASSATRSPRRSAPRSTTRT